MVPRVLQEVCKETHDRHARDHVSDVLSLLSTHALESNANTFAILVEGETTTVSAVDGGVDLDAKQFSRSLGVDHDLDTGDDAAGEADGVAHHRKADAEDGILQTWYLLAQLNYLQAVPELIVEVLHDDV